MRSDLDKSQDDPFPSNKVMPQPNSAGELLAVGQRRRIYIPEEVAIHNCVDDIWVTVLGKIKEEGWVCVLSQAPMEMINNTPNSISSHLSPFKKAKYMT